MKTRQISNKIDYGTLRISNEAISDCSFVSCGLSRGLEQRSVFTKCNFSKIRVRKSSFGFPIFDRCHFESITSDTNGVLIYGAGFKECTVSGPLKNVVIGFASEYVATYPERSEQAQRFQTENIEMASHCRFAIDVTEAELEFAGFRGEAIIPFVRCARDQAVILRCSNLFEKLRQLGRSQANRAKSNFYLGTGAMPGHHAAIATFNKDVREFIPEIETELREAGVQITHFDALN